MTGSLQTRGNYYYAVLECKDIYGKRKQKWISLKIKVQGNNKRKAKKKLNELIQQYEEREITNDYADIYFEIYMQKWLERKKMSVELSTWEGYEYHLKHIVEYFSGKKIKLSALKPIHIKEYYDYQLRYGYTRKRSGPDSGLSTRTVKSHSLLIKAALEEAVELNIISTNPAKKIAVPKKITDRQKSDDDMFMDEKEIEHFFEIIKGHRLYEVFIIILFFGLRRSEALGLKWSNIDFNNNVLYIRDTVVKVKTLQEKHRTKNKSSERSYPLTEDIKKLLLKLKSRQSNNRLFLHGNYIETDYVFTWEDGRPYSPDYLTKSFKKIVERDGVLSSDLTLHSLRKSCASLLFQNGRTLKEVQKWLGHKEGSTVTLSIYAKVKEESKIAVAETMSELLVI